LLGIAFEGFVQNLLRHHAQIAVALLPPIAGRLLFGGLENVLAGISHQIAHDRRLNVNRFHALTRALCNPRPVWQAAVK
jgi:hypothetical protein